MNRGNVLRELGQLRNVRGLAAKAVINYLVSELEEGGDSLSEEDIRRVLSNALALIEVEEGDILRVKELITRLIR